MYAGESKSHRFFSCLISFKIRHERAFQNSLCIIHAGWSISKNVRKPLYFLCSALISLKFFHILILQTVLPEPLVHPSRNNALLETSCKVAVGHTGNKVPGQFCRGC